MRNLVLILIAFIAAATFITAFDEPGAGSLNEVPEKIIELDLNN